MRFFAAGEQQHVLQALAGRRCDYVNAAFLAVLLIGEAHHPLPAAEELLEGDLEVLVDLVERLLELLAREDVYFFDRRRGVLDGLN